MPEPKKKDGLRVTEPKLGDRRNGKKANKEHAEDHRERFNALLHAAVRKREQED
jgi:hypothetical protein